jgi:hypothetical protein
MILHKEPPALTRLSPEATERLDEIVAKALAKDRENRYQVAKDVLIDLRRLKQHLEFESEAQRTLAPELKATHEIGPISGSSAAANQTAATEVSPTVSSAEYIVSEIKRHKKGGGRYPRSHSAFSPGSSRLSLLPAWFTSPHGQRHHPVG